MTVRFPFAVPTVADMIINVLANGSDIRWTPCDNAGSWGIEVLDDYQQLAFAQSTFDTECIFCLGVRFTEAKFKFRSKSKCKWGANKK